MKADFLKPLFGFSLLSFFLYISFLLYPSLVFPETIVLKATADIWLSDANEAERNSSSGKAKQFKLKSIQEMAVVRFDTSPIAGFEIQSARLFFYPVKNRELLKYIRVSTVTQTWEEGNSKKAYGKADGATYNFADANTRKPWAWEGSQFCDVSFGSGNSIATWDKIRFEPAGWVSVKVEPDLVYDMVSGKSDGLALQEGGSPALYNHFIYSVESGDKAPYLMVETGSRKLSGNPWKAAGNKEVIVSPGMVKIDPMLDMGQIQAAPLVFSGMKGECLDFQFSMEDREDELRIFFEGLDPVISPEAFKIWYSRTEAGKWQSAYLIPINPGERIKTGNDNRIKGKKNQSFYLDLYVKKEAAPGTHDGYFCVESGKSGKIHKIPLQLTVHDAVMPDQLSFRPEMNGYQIPENVHDYYRLAHKNRCTANFWAFRPGLKRVSGKIQVDWEGYDKLAGPLLSGEAFKDNPRKQVPVECMYLPFIDNWPTELTKENYRYDGHWPGKGESIKFIDAHYLKSEPIEKALSEEYKTNFLSVQKQFFDHFREKGWNRTEMQFFFGGKNTHRIDYGVNMWWTTDEPYHWEDWLALRFFNQLWTRGKEEQKPSSNFISRADISRPQWQGRTLAGVVDKIYYGGFEDPAFVRRCQNIAKDTGVSVYAYGNAGRHDEPPVKTFLKVVHAWLSGAEGFLPWQTIGTEASLDQQEGREGNAIFVPGRRFGQAVVGDMRLKAFRNAEQLIEYLVLLKNRQGLTKDQIKYDLAGSLQNPDAGQIEELKKSIMDKLLKNRL